jgi:UDP-N-acetylmuramoyl-L-alanyl-D-glutamate--2,6-diaminopimelate ligase
MISNIDDEYGGCFKYKNFKTLGFKDSDYKVLDYEYTNLTTKIKFSYLNNVYNVETNLLNKFNIYNYITALAFVNNIGVSIEDIINVTSSVKAPSGRNEIISVNGGKAIIDYAHTPDAVEKIIKQVSKIKHNKVITIIGCGGNRDKTKRPIMGDIATSYSDFVIFTSDNPRYEKPKKILKDIVCKLDKKNYKIVVKRKKAIKNGIQMLTKNDILLLLGKGHEDYQIIKNKKRPFSDKNIVLKYIRR